MLRDESVVNLRRAMWQRAKLKARYYYATSIHRLVFDWRYRRRDLLGYVVLLSTLVLNAILALVYFTQ